MTEIISGLILRAIGWGALIVVITWLPWPTIPTEVYSSLTTIISYASAFNPYVPVDTLFQLSLLALTIEVSVFLIRIASKIVSYFSGTPMPTDDIGTGQSPRTHLPL